MFMPLGVGKTWTCNSNIYYDISIYHMYIYIFCEFLHPHKYMYIYIYRYIHIFVTLPKLNLAPAKIVIGGKLRSFWGLVTCWGANSLLFPSGRGGRRWIFHKNFVYQSNFKCGRVLNSDDFHILGDIHEPNDRGLSTYFWFPILDDDSHSQGPPCNISKTPRWWAFRACARCASYASHAWQLGVSTFACWNSYGKIGWKIGWKQCNFNSLSFWLNKNASSRKSCRNP